MGIIKSSNLLSPAQPPTTHSPPGAGSQDFFPQLQEHGSRILPTQSNLVQKKGCQGHKPHPQMPSEHYYLLHSVTKSCYPLQNLKARAKPGKPSESKGCPKAWLHILMPGSKGNSSSESYWPIYLYTVLPDYKLKHPLPFY